MAKQLRLEVAQLTDVGRKREHNEDNMAYVIPKDAQVMATKGALFIVADGMGGHAAGEVASEIAVDTVSNAYYMDDNEDVVTPLLQAIKRANAAIHQRAAENMLRSGMGTTCVASVLRGNMAYIANVGDSRAYLVRAGQVKQISQDHSWVAEQVRAGLLSEEQARTHAQRNVITRCLGTQPDVEVDVFREPLVEGDCLVLCTDGLSGLISDDELRAIVAQSVPQESVYHLVERANENGGPDNITAIVVRVQEVGVEPVSARDPVRVGARELSEEETAALPAGAPMPYIAGSNTDGRVISAPLRLSSGPLSPSESVTAPQPALARRRSRLFFPTLLLLFLLIVAIAGGGVFYFLHLNEAQSIDRSLGSVESLIGQAKNEAAANPSQALKDLSSAQNSLRDLQKNHTLDDTQTSKLNQLQSQLVAQVKTAISNYNAHAQIVQLPCQATSSNLINMLSINTVPQSIASVGYGKGIALFSLGGDGGLYQLTTQNGLVNLLPASSNILAMNTNGAQLLLLTKQARNGSTTPPTYSVVVYPLDQNGKLATPLSATIDPTQLKGLVPSLVTAWGNNTYVVLSDANQNNARILDYVSDGKRLTALKPYDFSISAPISSVAAFADQIFLLSNGAVQSFPVAGAFSGAPQPQLPSPVLVQSPINLPLAANPNDFSSSMVVPTATPVEQTGNSPLTVAGANLLSVGVVNKVTHLYIGDSQNHRLLDLNVGQTASATPTATSQNATAGKSVMMQLVQQYVSSQSLPVVKSIAVDPQGTNINVLTQSGANVALLHIATGVSCTNA